MGVDKSEQRIREMFGEISPRYDFLNHFLSGGTDIYWRWKTVRTVKPVEGIPILDVCTGTGDLAIAYWKKMRGTTPVVGSDFTHEMLTLANEKTSQRCSNSNGETSPRFLEADTQRLPFADDSFQIVSVAFGLRNVTNTKQGLCEMTRVCRPGGHVLILEFSMPRNRLLRWAYGVYFRNVLPRLGQLVSRNRHAAYQYLPQSVSEFPEGDDLADLMRDCGLSAVTWKSLTLGVATLYRGEKASV